MSTRLSSAAILLFAAAGLGGCSRGVSKHDVLEHYCDIVHASYDDSHRAAVRLSERLRALAETPSASALEEAREAWLAAREPYGQTEAYRFYGGPIDAEDGPEGLLNAWPLDESYVDYVRARNGRMIIGGIINDVRGHPEIDRALLVSLNERGGEVNISCGYHAIEFLLWGQDLDAEGPGARSHADFTPGSEAPNPERRARYLVTVGELLVEHLASVRDAWAPGGDNYRASFLAGDPDEALAGVLTGIGVLAKSELAGERIFTAYDNQDQEDEHSCFSDNTHRDIITNTLGIRNVYLGRYERADGTVLQGPSLGDLIGSEHAEIDTELRRFLDESVEAVNAIPAPFDRAIVEADQRPQVLAAVRVLQSLGDGIASAAHAMGLTISTAIPE